MQMLKRHRLAVLNTWGKKSRAATYIHARGQSQIDFVCTRQAVSDGVSKTTGPVKTHMAGWRTTGHLPVVGSVPFRWTPWSKKQVKQGESAHGYDDTALRMMAEMKEPPSVKTLRDAVMRAGVLGPAKPVRPEREGVAGEVAQCWQLRRRLSILQTMLGGGLVVVFRYFKVRIAYLKAHRKLKKALRDGKRRQALALLQQAEEAAVRNDVRQMYGVVRLLCPNRHIQEIRLRDSKGQLMNGEAECRVWADYARKLFSAPKIEPFVLQRIPEEYISIDRWRRAFARLKAEKAAPNQSPPLRNWKAHAPLLDIQVQRIAQAQLCRDEPQIPEEWGEGTPNCS